MLRKLWETIKYRSIANKVQGNELNLPSTWFNSLMLKHRTTISPNTILTIASLCYRGKSFFIRELLVQILLSNPLRVNGEKSIYILACSDDGCVEAMMRALKQRSFFWKKLLKHVVVVNTTSKDMLMQTLDHYVFMGCNIRAVFIDDCNFILPLTGFNADVGRTKHVLRMLSQYGKIPLFLSISTTRAPLLDTSNDSWLLNVDRNALTGQAYNTISRLSTHMLVVDYSNTKVMAFVRNASNINGMALYVPKGKDGVMEGGLLTAKIKSVTGRCYEP